jgi:hypothetical protein
LRKSYELHLKRYLLGSILGNFSRPLGDFFTKTSGRLVSTLQLFKDKKNCLLVILKGQGQGAVDKTDNEIPQIVCMYYEDIQSSWEGQ